MHSSSLTIIEGALAIWWEDELPLEDVPYIFTCGEAAQVKGSLLDSFLPSLSSIAFVKYKGPERPKNHSKIGNQDCRLHDHDL